MHLLTMLTQSQQDGPRVRLIREPHQQLEGLLQVLHPHCAVILSLVFVTIGGLTARLVVRHRYWVRQCSGARLLFIRLPAEVDPAGGVVLWRHLLGLLAPPWKRWLCGQLHLVVEYRASTEGTHIVVWVPGTIPPGLVEHAITAAWPGASVERRPTGAPLPSGGSTEQGGGFGLAVAEWFPLHTDHKADPLRPLLETAGHLQPGETLCVQILTRPAAGRRLRALRCAAAHLRAGHSRGLPGFTGGLLRELLDLVIPGPAHASSAASSRLVTGDPMVAEDVRLVRDKAGQPQWETALRYAVATTDQIPNRARPRLRGLCDEVASAFAEYSGRNRLSRVRLRHPAQVLAGRRLHRGFLLSIDELAALAHLPYDHDTPGLERAGARTVAPRPRVPTVGRVLGDADTGVARPVALSVPDGRHHLQVIGATGSGKSTLLANLILDDTTARRGVLVIDPKGDLVTDLLGRIPADAADRVTLFDPDDHGPHPTLNVLSGPGRDVATDNLVGIFRRVYHGFWGPRTDDILRAACLTLTTTPGSTLADIPDLLVDSTYRRRITAAVTDKTLRGFWTWYEQQSEPARAQATAPLLNKLRALLLRPFIAQTLCSATSTVDLADVLDHGGICLVRAPKGILGPDTAALFGSLILAKTWEAATARAHRGEPARADASLYIDECHNFLNLPYGIDDMLAEARAFHLSLVLAHQNLTQLPRDLRDGISANARNKIFFASSPEDARDLARHLTPALSEWDLTHLDAFHAAVRILVDTAEAPAFTMRSRRLPPAVPGRAQLIRATSRAKHRQRTSARQVRMAAALPDPRRIPTGSRASE